MASMLRVVGLSTVLLAAPLLAFAGDTQRGSKAQTGIECRSNGAPHDPLLRGVRLERIPGLRTYGLSKISGFMDGQGNEVEVVEIIASNLTCDVAGTIAFCTAPDGISVDFRSGEMKQMRLKKGVARIRRAWVTQVVVTAFEGIAFEIGRWEFDRVAKQCQVLR